MSFKTSDIPDLKGKVAIVTGSNTGIGKVSALELARHGAHVILACRSADKTLPVVEEIKSVTGNEHVEFMALNLSSLKSVASFAAAFKAKNLPLHILMNNAGMTGPFTLTEDGIESTFGVNHLAPFYLTLLLFDVLERSQPARVVNTSSDAHWAFVSWRGIRYDKINDEDSYGQLSNYGESKLANILFTKELTRRIGAGRAIYVNAPHPGVIKTELNRNLGDYYPWPVVSFMRFVENWFFNTPENGALTQLYLAASPEVEKQNIRGEYFVPYGKKGTPSALARDEAGAKKLWDFSVNLIKEKVPDFEVPESLRVD